MRGIVKIVLYIFKRKSQLLKNAYEPDVHYIIGRIIAVAGLFILICRCEQAHCFIVYKYAPAQPQCFCHPSYPEKLVLHTFSFTK